MQQSRTARHSVTPITARRSKHSYTCLFKRSAFINESLHLLWRSRESMADRISTEPDMDIQSPGANEQEWLRVTLTSIGDAVLACDVHGCITYLNPMAVSLTGWELKEAQGLPIQDVFRIVDEKSGAPAYDIVECVLRSGCRIELMDRTALITKDGRAVPIEDSAAPIRDTAGSVVGVVLVFHDVIERRQKEKEFQQVNRTLRALTKVNQAMLHAVEEATLLQQVCEIIHKDCGYAMVWTGFPEQDAEKTVRPIAHAGVEDFYLKTVRITWDEDKERVVVARLVERFARVSLTAAEMSPRTVNLHPGALRRRNAATNPFSSCLWPMATRFSAFSASTRIR